MRVIVAIVSFALLMCVAATGARSATYSVSVRIHSALPSLSADEVNAILENASKVLQKPNLHTETDGDVKCDVTFKLKGSIGSFGEPANAIVTEQNIDGVMNSDLDDADFHIKVVKHIAYCRPGVDTASAGCSFSPPRYRSIVVVHPHMHPEGTDYPDHLLWAHEFGHLTGLGHREGSKEPGSPNDKDALMTRCDLKTQFPSNASRSKAQVSRNECRSLLAGPGHRSPGPFKLQADDCR